MDLSSVSFVDPLVWGKLAEIILLNIVLSGDNAVVIALACRALAPAQRTKGIALGADYAFDLTRPGIALYGGRQRAGHDAIRQVVTPEAQVLQRRTVLSGQTVGYNATWTAPADSEVAILNMGYADGYFRGFSDRGAARIGDKLLPVIGRVSMDLVAVLVDAAPEIAEGDWLTIDYDLPAAAAASGMSQYELITSLGSRFDRVWVD